MSLSVYLRLDSGLGPPLRAPMFDLVSTHKTHPSRRLRQLFAARLELAVIAALSAALSACSSLVRPGNSDAATDATTHIDGCAWTAPPEFDASVMCTAAMDEICQSWAISIGGNNARGACTRASTHTFCATGDTCSESWLPDGFALGGCACGNRGVVCRTREVCVVTAGGPSCVAACP